MTGKEIKYKSFSVIGAARSGVAAAKLLKAKGYDVFLSDSSPEEKINKDFVKEIKENQIKHEFGKHSDSLRFFEHLFSAKQVKLVDSINSDVCFQLLENTNYSN